jgi:Zn-dependent alcohol dehydrogenase
VHGVRAGSLEPQLDIPVLVDEHLRGDLELEALVGERIALDDIHRGIEALRAGAGARTLVVF